MVLQTHAFQWFVPHDGGGSGGSAKNGKKCSHRHLRLVPLHDSPNCPMFYGNAIAFPWCACGDPGRRCGGSKHCGAGSGLRGRGAQPVAPGGSEAQQPWGRGSPESWDNPM